MVALGLDRNHPPVAASAALEQRRLRSERLGRYAADPELETLGGNLDEDRVRLVRLAREEGVIRRLPETAHVGGAVLHDGAADERNIAIVGGDLKNDRDLGGAANVRGCANARR